ncbi:hypothetical protein BT63DRAFT_453004 [Microthyrium microscopicum]|uniref:Uncharacterized protein n=1 Tax=Microthyrium microscopicum TaxID=703497 RepID=A0A6A6ULE4_9PEZI|nr:hypothetical protein BT63DRAFT_453004 [Microthyrium microscopicum]
MYDRERSYRPSRRPSPPRDNYAGRGPSAADSYVPSARRRSRSPPYRRSPPRESTWRDRERERPRSPPRRRFDDEDRRDTRYRSPPREPRYARSPRRDRSRSPGFAKRARDYSPRPRSPPPKRERLASPPPRRFESPPRRRFSPERPRPDREYPRRSRSRSPRRDDRFEVPDRTRSYENDASAPISGATSRRSSPPPVHPSRMRLVPEERSNRPSPNQSPPRSPARRQDSRDYGGPVENPGYRNGDTTRAPPSGPAASRAGAVPPSGPAGSSGSRFNNPVLSAPSRPRGGRGGFGGGYRGDFGGPSPRRGDFGRGGYFGGPARGGYQGGNFRGSSNSSSSTYPRSQRFDTASSVRQHLSDLPAIVPGGQALPPLDPAGAQRLRRLEEEAARLREEIAEKQKIKRQGLKEWDKLQADIDSAQRKTEFQEENLRIGNQEEATGPAY